MEIRGVALEKANQWARGDPIRTIKIFDGSLWGYKSGAARPKSRMMHVSFGVLLGLVALGLAKPGYNYAQPQQGVSLVNQSPQNFVGQPQQGASLVNQQPPQSLIESHSSSSLQQVLPPLSQAQAPVVQSQAAGYQQSLSPISFLQFLPPLSFEQNLAPIQAPIQATIQAPIQAPNPILVPNFALPTQLLQPAPVAVQPVQQQLIQAPPQGAVVTKHVYVHVAPDEPPLPPLVLPPAPAPRKNYKIIFIKTPSQASQQRQVIQVPAQQAPTEEKTLVYVLVARPQQPQIVVQQPAVQQPSKPEVYFIKYKANSPAAAVAAGQSPVSSGESTSSLFSSGASAPRPQYGPPGYQKRST